MTMTFRGVALATLLGATALSGTAGTAVADCGIAAGRVSIVGNEFPAIKIVAARAAECATNGVKVKANLTFDHQKTNLPGMQGSPTEYTSSIVALMNEDVIRPLDDLVAAHGQDIPKNQLVTVDGQVKAVAFMANSQHLVHRKDVLEKVGVEPPKTHEGLLAAAGNIRAAGIMQYPLGGACQSGWNFALEDVNMNIGRGGEFCEPGTANVAINTPPGVAALEMMKALTACMNPDNLTHHSNALSAEWEAGNVALMNMWGARSGVLMDAEGAAPP